MESKGLARHWFVIYTKSRREKQVAMQLKQVGVEVYCPLLRTKRHWSDRMKEVEEPLFKSYCFVRLAEQERPKVFAVTGVVRYLFWLQKPAVVRDDEIVAIQEFLKRYDHQDIQIKPFTVDDLVRIKSGVFAEWEGVVHTTTGDYLSIYLDALQMMLTVDVRKVLLERIE